MKQKKKKLQRENICKEQATPSWTKVWCGHRSHQQIRAIKAPLKRRPRFIVSDAGLWVFGEVFTAHWGRSVWVTVANWVWLWVFGNVFKCMCGLQCLCTCACVCVRGSVCGPVQSAAMLPWAQAGFHRRSCLLRPQWGPHARVRQGILLCD